MSARPSGAGNATATANGPGTRGWAASSCGCRGCGMAASSRACWSRGGGLDGISQSQVSRLCAELDHEVERFRTRKLEGPYPYCWLDATFVKVRQDGRIVNMAVVIAVGVNASGQREILGLDLGPSEDGAFWTRFLRELVGRG